MTTEPLSKIRVTLGDVQETLLIPVYFRALETERPDAICRDPHALEILGRLDYDFSKFSGWYIQLDIAIRTEIFDEQVVRFISRHPDAAVLNLGAGLDARFLRVDNGRIRWLDLDMPEVVALRKHLLPIAERQTLIAKSVLDFSWLDDARRVVNGRPLLVVAEGLFCYFPEELVRRIVESIADTWPGAELVFQSISPEFVGQQGRIPAFRSTNASFEWGVQSGRELAQWRADYEFLGEWAYIDRHRHRWRHFRWARWLAPWKHRTLRHVMKISHLRLGRAEARSLQNSQVRPEHD